MRPLLTTDPESIGPYRLLARIGAGGMGVVYLARSRSSALAAVKVIRAEHATDSSFRARFRREARAAAQVDGRWTTPVLAADPEAAEPWLATAFVPGPSLAEIVAGHGPLPPDTVRALGARLAEALAAVHAARLVHRDIKPGNVLLSLDGPRLIDFGIARAGGATALTETDVVIGTPGYLSPEQARARGGEVGPPSDVFSLGCLLAYAVAGRAPYGTGMAAAVIFRTIHEAPDLTGVQDEPLRTLIARCLAKSPAARPTVPELRAGLGHFGTDDWLPPGLPALIAERSAQVLELPEPQRVAPPTLADRAVPPSRRRFLLLGSASAGVLAAGGAGAAWLATWRSAGRTAVPTRTIAVHTDLTGPGKALGTGIGQAVRLAVSHHNAHPGRRFDLALQVHDDHGEASRSQAVARQVTADARVCAVIGPSSDTTALAARDIYTKASLPIVTAWAGSIDLYDTVSSTHPGVFQIRPADDGMPTPLFRYLTGIRPASRWALIEDGTAPDFGWLIAKPLMENAPVHGTIATHTVPADSDDFAPAAAAVLAARAQAVVYCGNSPQRAAAFARALRTGGFTGTAAAAQPVLDPAFLSAAGAADEGWVFSSTWVDPARLASAAGFVRAFTRRYGVRSVPPGAAEAYDALGMVADVLTDSGAGPVDPGSLSHRLRSVSYQGITRTFAFDASTGAVDLNPGLFLWRVRQGRPDFLGQYQKVRST
ncbi:bifunctional serine/threonine-protein kinase/ABC transporter substrate-binding protein [Streptomyces sp. FXJ1.172]|uniref:bifunctional serine/threonine-protein kinase/ABC transporter substrate-binding protein n=1 Tax=Streptomyces sp. FXJ1.172 TaxID=710705 RepID=UPI0007CF3117|nr:bifunctional serine/threonine-protein kinase/ABC transporter substrate-binding protein [Streptomyces sp. FXJ1.172]WEP00475.1 bifunctional serine/threonine-protein kinase/ABC transporter substrate-binding protein [Streptomyces sp. FXJ1.172]